ncbi:uncharacterized protein LOC102493584 isoform X2 [Tupaia chinensis]|uniref:uncharacterized protein LOC102493584 isoform X2 n=1 Tax=Tupaia chinensis TaxID=246437 RepID=UPI0003C9197D|nr:uncharacterized protein LOC102493584 isoform X2 [Tupaia chinensis]
MSQQPSQDPKEKFLTSEATASSLANQLQKYKTGNGQKDEKEEEPAVPELSRELQEKEEVNEVQNDTLDGHHDSSDSSHPPSHLAFLSDEREVDFAQEENTQETECLRKTQVSSGAQLQGSRKEVEKLKAKLKELTENFQEIQKKIAQFRDISIAHKKEFFRKELFSEEEEGDLPQNILDKENLTTSSKFELSDSEPPLEMPISGSDIHEVCSNVDASKNTDEPKCLRKSQVNSGVQLQGPRKEVEKLKMKLKQLSENFQEIQKKIILFRDISIAYKKEFFRWELLSKKEEMSRAQQHTRDEQNLTICTKFERSDSNLPPHTPLSQSDGRYMCPTVDAAEHTQQPECL